MKSTEQLELFLQDCEARKEILFRKANDYSNEADVLSNFKLTAQVAMTTPQQFAMNMIALKTVRLGNLIGSGKSPMNESVINSIEDLENYAFLLKCIINEEKRMEATKVAERVANETIT